MEATQTRALTQQDLTDKVHGLLATAVNPRTKVTAEQLVKAIVSEIGNALGEGREVKLMHFGRFFVRTRPARKNFNLHKGEMEELPAKRVVAFAPGQRLKNAVAG